MEPTLPRAPQYVADVSPVREITLHASANLAYWQEQLAPYALHCAARNGRAQLLISSAAARFKGIPFRELSISVGVCRTAGGSACDGYFLLHAFNSVRFFAFVERNLFHTPYFPARLVMTLQPRMAVSVLCQRTQVFTAAMGAAADDDARRPECEQHELWSGPIFLPGRTGATESERRLFLARIEGLTQTYTFAPARDVCQIQPHAPAPALAWLLEADFRPEQWTIRPAARHAKSKTVRRIPAFGFD